MPGSPRPRCGPTCGIGRRDVALFEMGRVFAPARAACPREERRLALLLSGQTQPAPLVRLQAAAVRPLRHEGRRRAAVRPARRRAAPEHGPRAAPARATCTRAGRFGLCAGDGPVGYARSAPPGRPGRPGSCATRRSCSRSRSTRCSNEPPRRCASRALDRFPAVERDLSILCDEPSRRPRSTRACAQRRGETAALREPRRPLHRQPVPPGKVSLTVSLRFQDRERTLTRRGGAGRGRRAWCASSASAGLEIRGE